MPKPGQEETAGEQAAEVQETDTALADFAWDDSDDDTFFGIETPPEERKEIPKEEEEEEEDAEGKAEEEEKIEDDFFGETTEDGKMPKSEEEEEEEEENIQDSNRAILLRMKEKGLLHNAEIPEEGEIADDMFIELQDSEIESRVDEAFEGFFSELDEDAAAFLKFKKEGGDTQKFFEVYSQSGTAPTGDLDDETYQEKVSRYYYKTFDKDESEDIDDKIEWLKDSGKLEKYAAKFDSKIKESEKKAKEDLQEEAKAADKAAETSRKNFVNSVQEALDVTDKVDNFIFTPKGKKSLLPFITKQSVKVGKNKYITPMQSKLQTALKTPEKMLILAQLLENDFDVSSVINGAETIKTKKLKNDVQRQKSVRPKSSGRSGTKRSLADVDF